MSASPRSLFLLLLFAAASLLASPLAAQAQSQSPASLWDDFNHYTLVARPKLAHDAATTLLERVNKSRLLDIVEASNYADTYQNTLDRARRIKPLHNVAIRLANEIQGARIARARDPKRIARNIALLDQGQRAYINAVARLKGAGQYAASQLLAALQNSNDKDLHPYILNAMQQIGQSLVRPLAAALPHLDAATMGQVAQVLAEIGYPQALPVLRRVASNPKTDPDARKVVLAAYQQLLAQVGKGLKGLDAAELYVKQGAQAYSQETAGHMPLGYDAAHKKGIVWIYNDDTGLVPIPVPGPIFGDVIAMRDARRALQLNHNMNTGLSLWLMANLRRANHLSKGQVDPTYGRNMRHPQFYAMLAGPMRLQDVLTEALKDRDAKLALNAIEALQKTAGTNALINKDAGRRPLLEALSYPDVRVRFRAAVALAKARPAKIFPGAERVVPVLAASVRASGAKYALVLADNQQRRNDLMAYLHHLGYEAIAGKSLHQLADAIDQRPSIDLIVVDQPLARIRQIYAHTASNYKLAAVPVLALASASDQMRLQSQFGQNKRVATAVAADEKAFQIAVKSLTAHYAGVGLTGGQANAFALTALKVLRDIAWNSRIYKINDAESAVIHAVADKRIDVANAAAEVLALINDQHAQRALADQALHSAGQRRIDMLNQLSDSATHYGNMLSKQQIHRINQLVLHGNGALALAAARAHGALTLPTASAVNMILK